MNWEVNYNPDFFGGLWLVIAVLGFGFTWWFASFFWGVIFIVAFILFTKYLMKIINSLNL